MRGEEDKGEKRSSPSPHTPHTPHTSPSPLSHSLAPRSSLLTPN
ncbi:hypothetical protein [Chroococcidiopsis sp.]